MKPPYIGNTEKREIIHDYKYTNKSVCKIADEHGMTSYGVMKIIKNHTHTSSRYHRKCYHHPDNIKVIESMMNDGSTLSEIAERFNVDKTILRRYIESLRNKGHISATFRGNTKLDIEGLKQDFPNNFNDVLCARYNISRYKLNRLANRYDMHKSPEFMQMVYKNRRKLGEWRV